jgi:hypothetical protein
MSRCTWVVSEDAGGEGGLERGEMEMCVRIVVDDEGDGAIAEAADAVEEDQGVGVEL